MPSTLVHDPTRSSASAQRLYVGIAVLIILFTSLACTFPAGMLLSIGPADGTLVIDRGGNERINDALIERSFIVTAGSKDGDFVLTAHNPDGLLLQFLGDNGIGITDFGGNDQATAVDRGTNRVFAAGTSDQRIALAAYSQDGNLDPGFGDGGKVLTTLPGGAVIRDLWVTEQGALFVVGTTEVGGVPHFLLVAYSPNGTLNPGFGQDGVVTTAIGSSAHAYAVKLDPNDNIMVAGHSTSPTGEVLSMVRYLPDGSLDPSFGTNGIVTTSVPGGNAFAYDLRYQEDNKFLVAGEWRPSPSGDARFMLARYLPDGTLDPDFDGSTDANGLILTAFSGASAAATSIGIYEQASAGVLQIVLAGFAQVGSNAETFAMAAYTADGSLDTRFGTDGLTTTSLGGANARVTKAILDDGQLLTVGYSGTNFALARYTFPGGTLDPAFGVKNFLSNPVTNTGPSGAKAVTITASKMVVAGGYSHNSSNLSTDFALVTYNDLRLVQEVLETNVFTTDFGGSSEAIEALANHNDGHVVAAGSSDSGGSVQFALARYAEDGSLDTGFGPRGTGFFTTTIGTSSIAHALLTLPDNRVIAAGHSQDATGTGLALAAYMPNGSLDTSFGQGGIVTTTLPGGATYGADMTRHPDGSLIVVGRHEPTTPGLTHLVVARYTPTGSLDSAFGNAGIVTTTLPSANLFGRAVLLQPDGKILVGGDSQPTNGGNSAFVLVRYMPNGTLDPSFGTNGMASYTLDTAQGTLRDLHVQRDGKLVVMGQTDHNILIGRFLLDDGGLDTNFFGKQGWVTQTVWQHQLQPTALAVGTLTMVIVGQIQPDAPAGIQAQNTSPAFPSFYFHEQNLVESNFAQLEPGGTSKDLSGMRVQLSPDATEACPFQTSRQPRSTMEKGLPVLPMAWSTTPGSASCLVGLDLTLSYSAAEVMYGGGSTQGLTALAINSDWPDDLCLEHTCVHDPAARTISVPGIKEPPMGVGLGFPMTTPITETGIAPDRFTETLPRVRVMNGRADPANPGRDLTCDVSALWRSLDARNGRVGAGEIPSLWAISTSCNTEFTGNLRLYYTDSDLRRSTGVVTDTLKAYQFVDGVWVDQCASHTCTRDTDLGNMDVEGITSLGGFWMLANNPPINNPITGFSATSTNPTMLGQSTTFTATLTTGTNVTYSWDFGDGVGTGSGANPSYTYPAAGVYTTTVTATNPLGSQQAQSVVTVTPLPRFVLFFPWVAR